MAKLTEKEKKARAKKRDKNNRADLKIISPGVMVDKNYKPGKNPAVDAVLRKLGKNPKSLDSSGYGNRWEI